jgi:hypothetical protein
MTPLLPLSGPANKAFGPTTQPFQSVGVLTTFACVIIFSKPLH